MKKEKVGYVELLNGEKSDIAQKLALLNIQRRIKEDDKLNKTFSIKKYPGEKIKHSNKNIAAISFSVTQGNKKITVEPKAFASCYKKTRQGRH